MSTDASNKQLSKPAEINTIKGLLAMPAVRTQIAEALPSHCSADRFMRIAATCIRRVPKLAQCDQTSFFNALLSLSQLGLEPDGRNAHLIPFNNNKAQIVECQLIVDYKGYVELAMRSGQIASIHADVVCEEDEFEYDMGQVTRHKINWRKPRGAVYAVYCRIQFKDGAVKCETMSANDVERIRKRSRAGNSGPWVTDWEEMAKKTVFRRATKWISLSAEFRDALDKDFDNVLEIPADRPQPKKLTDLADQFSLPDDTSDGDQSDSQPSGEVGSSEPPVRPKPTRQELLDAVEVATTKEDIEDLVYQASMILSDEGKAAVEAAATKRKAALRGK